MAEQTPQEIMIDLMKVQSEKQLEAIEASKLEASALLLSTQAADRQAVESKRAADSNMEMIEGVNKLIETSTGLVESVDLMEAVSDQLRQLIQMNGLIVAVISKGNDSDEIKNLQSKMHELAMSAASKGIKIDQSTRFEGEVSTDGGDIIAGDKKESS